MGEFDCEGSEPPRTMSNYTQRDIRVYSTGQKDNSDENARDGQFKVDPTSL